MLAATVSETNGLASDLEERHVVSHGRRFLFTTIVLVLTSLLLETGSRVWFYFLAPASVYPCYALAEEFPSAAKYTAHHYLGYGLQPGYARAGCSHNSLGYRGPEIAVPKPNGCFRVAILGGSTTYGEFIPEDDHTFPAQLERILHQRGYSNVDVVNAGCPGYTSWESLVNLQFRVLDLEPDLVIVYHAINDVHARLVRPDTYQGDNAGRRKPWSPPLDVRILRHSCLARIVGYHLGVWRPPGVDCYVQAPTSDPGTHGASAAIGGDPQWVLSCNPPEYFRRNLRNLAAIAEANGARVLLATWAHSRLIGDYASTPHYQHGIAENNAVVREVADELNVPCFDFAPLMPMERRYWRDGRHVNADGAALQAELFADFIVRDGLLAP